MSGPDKSKPNRLGTAPERVKTKEDIQKFIASEAHDAYVMMRNDGLDMKEAIRCVVTKAQPEWSWLFRLFGETHSVKTFSKVLVGIMEHERNATNVQPK